MYCSRMGASVTMLLRASLLWSCAAAASVNVALEASFPTPPFLLELIETAAQENASSYFPLLDLTANGRFAEASNDKALYATFVQALRDEALFAGPDSLSTFELAASIHAASPRIEAQYQYYKTSIEPLLPAAQDAACPVWVHLDGKQYCSPTLERAQQDFEAPDERDLPFDRSHSLHRELPIATLYTDINSPLFNEFHQELKSKADAGTLTYRIRYRPPLEDRPRLSLSGYGVELSLKRTDYIVIDDRAEEKDSLKQDEEAELDDLKPLSTAQLGLLPLKTASYIMNSEDPFETLEEISQNFPKHSSKIANTNVTKEFFEEHERNRGILLGSGFNVVWMNGLQLDALSMNAFTLLDKFREERRVVENMKDIGLSASETIALLSHRAITESKTNEETQRYDYRDTLEDANAILWLNDIERDKRYAEWPAEATMLLQPTFPGQLPSIRRDIHNVIVPVDLTAVEDLEEITQNIQMLIKRLIPIRFGLVLATHTPEAERRAQYAYYIQDKYGLGAMFDFFAQLAEEQNAQITEQKVTKLLQGRQLRKNREETPVAEASSAYADNITASQRYLRRLGIVGATRPSLVNGIVVPRGEAWMQSMSQRISYDMSTIQRKVYEAGVADDEWIAGHFLEGVTTSRNSLITPDDEDMEKMVDIGAIVQQNKELIEKLPRVPAAADVLKNFWSYTILCVDLESAIGAQLAKNAIEWRQNQLEADLLILHNGASERPNPISAALFEAMSGDINLDTLNAALEKGTASEGLNEMADAFWMRFAPLIRELGLKSQENYVILNGRIVGPITPNDVFDTDCFTQLLSHEQKKRISPVVTALSDLQLEDRIDSPLALARVTSMIELAGRSEAPEGIYAGTTSLRMDHFSAWNTEHTAIVTSNGEEPLIQIVASIDPTTELAQRWIPILRVLSKLEGVSLKLFLNPREAIREIPIKRFYRHVLSHRIQFDEDGNVEQSRASFQGLPRKALLNFGMDLPPAWLVSPKESVHDLDNIKLSALKAGQDVNAVYELEHILIEGHTRDVTSGQPPRGAQLWLGTDQNEHFADTLIMANLGYFQFKANPGHWNIQFKPGRSQEIFQLDNIGLDGYSKEIEQGPMEATLMSFQGLTLFPTISRKPGHEMDDVLSDAQANTAGAYVAKASNLASGLLSKAGFNKRSKHADINIFSVASGHLYERMLNIMMVSVMRHTKHSVKFWFIEQFLSPSFKKTLPALAKEYNFEYEMVTYKWPHWLRGQREKQREIWGYKILFLDVLFPLSLDKVIFVDADQVVRADMYELVTHDLEGAPYGFTPMCDSRTEIEGFRFWKEGYWKNFLRGLPYHISALYVVDLKKFRQLAAGDRLRQQYHQLSADPNSLSNLDQDLPNNMQFQLPIHSLPQEWLWCETWCSDESLKDAKTIDLCNNPQTFEPKLDRARRQVPEWTVYDDEIAGVIQRSHLVDDVEDGANVQEELDRSRKADAGIVDGSATVTETPFDASTTVPVDHKIKDEL